MRQAGDVVLCEKTRGSGGGGKRSVSKRGGAFLRGRVWEPEREVFERIAQAGLNGCAERSQGEHVHTVGVHRDRQCAPRHLGGCVSVGADAEGHSS